MKINYLGLFIGIFEFLFHLMDLKNVLEHAFLGPTEGPGKGCGKGEKLRIVGVFMAQTAQNLDFHVLDAKAGKLELDADMPPVFALYGEPDKNTAGGKVV